MPTISDVVARMNQSIARQGVSYRANMTPPESVMDLRFPAWRKSQDQATVFDLIAGMPGPGEVASGLKTVAGLLASKAGAAGPLALGATVWHGSPHKFDRFDSSKVGTGDAGGTSFGLGINLSKDPRHASAYKGKNGTLYKVDLPDDELPHFLQWEQPVPKSLAEQLPPVDMNAPLPFGGGATIERDGYDWKLKSGASTFRLSEKEMERMFGSQNTGEQVYRRLVASLGGDERAASSWLKERGYKGMINNTERNAENYVVFDDQIPKIVGRE